MNRKIEIYGLPVEVVSEEEAEKSSMVVCMPSWAPSPFDDNVIAQCADCHCEIIHRPYAPKTPPKVCVPCAMKRLDAEGSDDAVTLVNRGKLN